MSHAEPPKSRCVVWRTTHTEQHQRHIHRYIHTHPFNHQVDIVIPHCATLPPPILSHLTALSSRHEYCVMQCDTVVLLQMALKAAQSGHAVFACSVQQHQDATNVISIASDTRMMQKEKKQCFLNMQLDKDTYEQCGLQGAVSEFRYDKLFQARYNVEVDLLKKRSGKHADQWLYAPGRPIYENLMRAVKRLGEVIILFAAYNAHQESIDARVFVDADNLSKSPIHFTRIKGFGEDNVIQHLKKLQWIPRFMNPETRVLSAESDMMGMMHWLGMVTCGSVEHFDITDDGGGGGIDNDGSETKEQPFQTGMQLLAFNSLNLSTEDETDEDQNMGQTRQQAHHMRIRGFIPTFHIESIMQQLRNCMKSSNGTIDWIGMVVSGMEDSPISWLQHERHFGPVSGENDYCVVMHNDRHEQCWWMNALGQKDTYS